jgi:hypothetical protein
LNPGRRGGKPVTNRLSYGAAKQLSLRRQKIVYILIIFLPSCTTISWARTLFTTHKRAGQCSESANREGVLCICVFSNTPLFTILISTPQVQRLNFVLNKYNSFKYLPSIALFVGHVVDFQTFIPLKNYVVLCLPPSTRSAF